MRIIFLLVLIAASYSASAQSDLTASIARGKVVYEGNCIACHQPSGEGLEGTFPPLANTGRLTDKARLVNNIYNGASGAITVNGKNYDMEMFPVPINDKEIADVLNYVRNSWGNKNAELITEAEVKSLKK